MHLGKYSAWLSKDIPFYKSIPLCFHIIGKEKEDS